LKVKVCNFAFSNQKKLLVMATTKWILDPTHSELGFKIKHLMITNVSGWFNDFAAEAETDGDSFETAQIHVRVNMTSINTNNSQRDEHLRSSDFFEVKRYPELLFESTGVKKIDEENHRVYGNLTMKGITKPVQLNVEYSGVTKDPWGGERAGFIITGKIKRSEWGVNFNDLLETGGVVLSDEVKIHSELQLVKQAVPIAA
jgi:polyisoprenoid-binding protein YceI